MITKKFIVEVDYFLFEGQEHDLVDVELVTEGVILVMNSLNMDREIAHFEGIEVTEIKK